MIPDAKYRTREELFNPPPREETLSHKDGMVSAVLVAIIVIGGLLFW